MFGVLGYGIFIAIAVGAIGGGIIRVALAEQGAGGLLDCGRCASRFGFHVAFPAGRRFFGDGKFQCAITLMADRAMGQ